MKKNVLLFALILFIHQGLFAQDGYAPQPRNLIKVNLTSLAINNYSLQYERVLNKTISVAVAYRFMPDNSMPFKDKVIKYAGIEDQEALDAINTLKLSNFALTPEVRFYLGKRGYGRGFYVSLFYRYSNFDASDINVDFEDQDLAINTNVTFSGKLTSHTAGFVLGSQWALGKHLCLDVWFLGPHFGVLNADVSGLPDHILSPVEQNYINEKLSNIDDGPYKTDPTVTAGNVRMKVDGPFGGYRAGVSLGIKF